MRKNAILAVAVFALGCGATTDVSLEDAITRSNYRVVMSMPLGGGTRDVYHARGQSWPDFPRVAEDVCTGYVPLDAGSYDINVHDPAGSDPQVPHISTKFAQTKGYLFVMRVDGGGTQSITQHFDSRTDAGPGLVRLRFVNATTEGIPFDVTELATGAQIAGVTADTSSLEGGPDNDANFQLTVKADTPIGLQLTPGGTFVTEPLPSNALVTVVARDASSQPSLVIVPPVGSVINETQTSHATAAKLLVINDVPEDPGLGALVDYTQGIITIGSRSASLPQLQPAGAIIIIAVPDPDDDTGLKFLTFRDISSDGFIRAINATTGLSAPDVTLDGTAIAYNDLVFGSPLTQPVPDPTGVTGVTVTDASGTFTYAPVLTTTTRYMVFVGDVASGTGLATLNLASDGSWTSAFVTAL